jgi:hypothetical protein
MHTEVSLSRGCIWPRFAIIYFHQSTEQRNLYKFLVSSFTIIPLVDLRIISGVILISSVNCVDLIWKWRIIEASTTFSSIIANFCPKRENSDYRVANKMLSRQWRNSFRHHRNCPLRKPPGSPCSNNQCHHFQCASHPVNLKWDIHHAEHAFKQTQQTQVTNYTRKKYVPAV